MLFILCIPMVFSTDEIAYRKVSSPLVVTKMFFFSLFVTCNLGMASRYAPHDPIGVDLIRYDSPPGELGGWRRGEKS